MFAPRRISALHVLAQLHAQALVERKGHRCNVTTKVLVKSHIFTFTPVFTSLPGLTETFIWMERWSWKWKCKDQTIIIDYSSKNDIPTWKDSPENGNQLLNHSLFAKCVIPKGHCTFKLHPTNLEAYNLLVIRLQYFFFLPGLLSVWMILWNLLFTSIFCPTGRSATHSIPNSSRWLLGPTPDNIRS